MSIRILIGDCIASMAALPAASVQCCVTSPPYYGLRDYGMDGQIGLEESPEAFVGRLVDVFREVRRVLRDDGTLWLNLGDSYAGGGGFAPNAPSNLAGAKQTTQQGAKPGGIKPGNGVKAKDLLMIPAQVALALRADGWFLRSDIIWHKPNPMPESVTDRPTWAHEHVFLLTKGARYFYDAAAIREVSVSDHGSGNGFKRDARESYKDTAGARGNDQPWLPPEDGARNARNVWTIASQPFSGAHFATMPPELAERCIKAGSKPGDLVLDPFGGAGTTGLVADRLGRDAVLCELNPAYAAIAERRLSRDAGMFGEVHVQETAA